MSGLPDIRSSSVSTAGYEDGLGRRSVRFNREVGGMLECLHLRPQFLAFEPALRERVRELEGLDDERFARTRGIEKEGGALVVTSELVTGHRLIDVLETRQAEDAAVSGIDAAFGFLLQAMPALAELHATSITHGAVAPGRIIITPNSQVVLLDSIYGAALERLNLNRRTLWTSFGIMVPPLGGTALIDPCSDVAQVALCALLLAAGRPPDRAANIPALAPLVREVAELAEIRAGAAFAEGVGRFFKTTLPAEGNRPSVASEEAAAEIRRLVSHISEDESLNALAELVCFHAPVHKPAASAVDSAHPAAPARNSESASIAAPRTAPVVAQAPAGAPAVPITAVPALHAPPIALVPAPPPPPIPEPVTTPAAMTAVPFIAAAVPEPPSVLAPPVAATPPVIPAPPVIAPPPVSPAPPVIAAPPVLAAPPASPAPPLIAAPPASPAPPLVAAPPVIGVPASAAAGPPIPLTLLAGPADSLLLPAPPVTAAAGAFVDLPPPVIPVRPPVATAVPPPTVFAPSVPAAVEVMPAPAPAVLRIRQDPPKGYAPPRSRGPEDVSPAALPARALPFVGRGIAGIRQSTFPWKLAAAAVVVMSVGVLAGRAYLLGGPLPLRVPVAATGALSSTTKAAPAAPPAAVTGSLAITSQPSGATVILNDKVVGVTPLTLDAVPAGRHQVAITDGTATVQRTVQIEAGKHDRISVPVFSGWVAIFAPIRLDVSEGRRSLGTTETGRILLSPGRHVLTLSNSEFGFSTSQTVEIRPGEERVLNLRPMGLVNLNASPWAEVWVDGARAGETPLANLEVPLGTREFVFKHPQYGERRLTATITTSASALSVDFGRPPSRP